MSNVILKTGTTEVRFDVRGWEDTYGAGTYSITAIKPESVIEYDVSIDTSESGTVIWLVSESDLSVSGYGKCILKYTVNGTLVKSTTYQTAINISTASSGKANRAHTHSANDIVSDFLPVDYGGTGMTVEPSMLTNLASTTAAGIFQRNPRPGVTGALPIANGGTGATSASSALNKLGAATKDHTHDVATTTEKGFMSAKDKEKLDNISDGATAYEHPTYDKYTGAPGSDPTPAFGGSFSVSQVITDELGHVSKMNTRSVKIPNTVASQSAAGLMSATDKKKLDELTDGAAVAEGTVKEITTGVGLTGGPITDTGEIKANLVSETKLTSVAAAATLKAGRVYPIALDSSGRLAVNVPWLHPTDLFGECSTAANVVAKTVSITGPFYLVAGASVYVKFAHTNTASGATLNVNGTGAKAIMTWGTEPVGTSASTSWSNNTVMHFVYDGTYWFICGMINTDNNTLTQAYCTTAPGFADKTATCTQYSLLTNSYLMVNVTQNNTAQSALTFNVNGNGAKPIYINGTASSSENYTLPAGSYLTFYSGSAYHFRTDGKIPGTVASAASLASAVTIITDLESTEAATFEGNADVEPGVKGTLPVSKGGTGATTAEDARANLGAASTGHTHSEATTTYAGFMSADDKKKLNSATSNTGTVTSVATGVGLTGGTITSSGTIKANLLSETKLSNAATAATETANRVYPVALDKNGYLAVNVPWSADDTNTVPQAYCDTAAATAAKAATCTNYSLKANSYIMVLFRYANSVKSALTLNINGTGAKAIYINATASSSSNYTLPAGSYMVRYNGTAYYLRTDALLPASIDGNAATATKLATARTLTTKLDSTTAASFDGSANKEIGISGTLSISNGGTGATNAAAARSNLGAAAADHTHDTAVAPTESTAGSAGFMSAADKQKLDYLSDNQYVHPGYTADTSYPQENVAPGFGGSFNISTIHNDSLGHIEAMETRTVTFPNTLASADGPGLMSSSHYNAIESLVSGAVTGVKGSKESSFRTGDVSLSYANVGAAAEDHDHDTAVASAGSDAGSAGFMSAADKAKLDGITSGADVTPKSSTTPSADTASGSAGTASTVSRSDHRHPLSSYYLGNGTGYIYPAKNGGDADTYLTEYHGFVFNMSNIPTNATYGWLDVSKFDGSGFAPAPTGVWRQVFTQYNTFDIYYRTKVTENAAWGSWVKLVKASGDTMTGALNFANNTWNSVGDDCYMGDCNTAGKIGLKANNGKTGIHFVSQDGNSSCDLEMDGTKLNAPSGLQSGGNDVLTTGKMKSTSALTNSAAATSDTSGKVYPVVYDSSGYLSVCVPWTSGSGDFTNKGLNGANIDSEFNSNYVVLINGSGYGTLPNSETLVTIFNIYTNFSAVQIATKTTTSSTANRSVSMWAREHYVSSGAWSNWRKIYNASDIIPIANGGTGNANGYIRTGLAGGSTAGAYATAEGTYTKPTGTGSHAEGYGTEASGNYSHAEGYNCSASGGDSHAEGINTDVTGNYSHAEGYGSVASGVASHAGGQSCTTSGDHSFAHGLGCTSVGCYSSTFGAYTKAQYMYETVVGKYNTLNTTYADTNHTINSATSIFLVGCGTADASANRANAFRVGSTAIWANGTVNATGADYAEMFEWADGNPENEDRVGLFVTLTGKKIRLAASEDDFILGIVSAKPSACGEVYDDNWQNKWLKDVFGRTIYEDVEVPDEIGPDGKIAIPAHTEKWPKPNPDYDPSKPYTPRSERPEWSPVGMLGKLVTIDDGTCEVDGWATVGEGGKATFSETRTKYRVMDRLDETHIQILIL